MLRSVYSKRQLKKEKKKIKVGKYGTKGHEQVLDLRKKKWTLFKSRVYCTTTVNCICSEHQSYEITPFAAYLPVHTFPCNQSLQVRSFGPEGTAVDSSQWQ